MILAGSSAIFLLVFLFWAAITLNRFTRLDKRLMESWSDVDVCLQRRYDLIPNLVDTVKGLSAYEQKILQNLAELRSEAAAISGNVGEKGRVEADISIQLVPFLARIENYPALRASDAFAQLQQELCDTEDRIAAARRLYNANVRDYNSAIHSFPASLLKGSRLEAEYFEAVETAKNPFPIDIRATS